MMSDDDDDFEYDYKSEEDDTDKTGGGPSREIIVLSESDGNDDECAEYDYKSEEDVDMVGGLPQQERLPADRETSVSSWDGPRSALSPSNNQTDTGIRMMGLAQLRPEMLNKMKEVAEYLNVPVEAAALLLNQFAWSRDSLLEQYVDQSENILQKAGVFCRCTAWFNSPNGSTLRTAIHSTANSMTCYICYDDDLNASDMYCMPCQHPFCISCWKEYLHNALYESGLGPSAVFLTRCPREGCQEKVTEREFSTLFSIESDITVVTNGDVNGNLKSKLHPDLARYRNFLLRSYVEMNPLTQGCPAPGCDRVASALSELALKEQQGFVVCDNVELHSRNSSMPFCFCMNCGHGESHAPVACKLLQMWEAKCRNESETANWILANTKACPKCSSRIEKNQGKVTRSVVYWVVPCSFGLLYRHVSPWSRMQSYDLSKVSISFLLDLYAELVCSRL
jgi:ariadne-1